MEALLDIQVSPASGMTLERIGALDSALAPKYRRRGAKRHAGFQFILDSEASEGSAKASAVPVGYVYGDETGRLLVQATANDFTQNMLKPYSDFEALVAEAKTNWEKYVETCKPLSISRVALRYINDLRLPPGAGVFQDYLPYSPDVPEGLPQMLSDFAYRVTVDDEESGAKIIVNQLYQGMSTPEGVQVLLDIDAFFMEQIEVGTSQLWDRLDMLRNIKNRFFFSFVTDQLLEKYE